MRQTFGFLALLAGCTAYRPGSFVSDRPFAGTRTTVGCLDVAIERRGNLDGQIVLDYQFGNRCDRAVPIDLANVAVIARARDGTELRLAPYDPDQELRPLRVGGLRTGREALAYPYRTPLVEVCVDAASLTRAAIPLWTCFGDRSGLLAEVTP